MTEDRWQRVKALFQMTVDRPPSERAAFLASAVDGDDALRREVESLLSADSRTENFTDGLPIAGGAPEESAVFLPVTDASPSPAVLTAGLVVGSYAVVAPLGVGGMGEVYRARDARLNRDVALKVLQPRFVLDPSHLARFRREAQALAALNHPNIAAIYGLEESQGHQALVLELVEGPTLADRIVSGPVPLHEALLISRQLAEALKAAHEKWIVHRDLKPANIKITPNDVVKVLDFGLAKAAEGSEPSGLASSRSSSLTANGTTDGVILGTAAYMSPEQTRGQMVDTRADIWAFGCVLFEMLTGCKAFDGDTPSRTISAVLEGEPDWQALPAATPALVRRLLRGCLEKDVARRQRDMREVLSTIEELLKAGRESSRRARARRWAMAISAIALFGAAVAGYVAMRNRPAQSVAPVAPSAFKQLTSQPGIEWFPSLSPDRQWLVYAGEASGNRDIYLQSVTGRNATNLTTDSPEDDDQPAFSPDGDRIAFRSERDGGGIFVMDRTGHGVRRLTRTGYRPTWSHDGRQLAYISNNVELNIFNARGPFDLWVVDVNSGRSRPLLADRLRNGVAQASWSPSGKMLVVTLSFASSRLTDIATVAVDGGLATTIVSGPATDWNPVWSADGRHIYFTSDRGGSTNLWRIAVDERSGQALAEPEPITVPSSFVAHPAVSTDGRDIVFSSVSITMNVVQLALDPSSATITGEPIDVTTGSRAWANPDPSPNGEWVAFYSRENPEGHVYVSRTDGSGLRQLTHDAVDRVPRWSPDGRWITFFSTRGNAGFRLWGMHPDASGLRQFTDIDSLYPVWSPDGARMAVSSRTGAVIGNPVNAPKVFVFDPTRPWSSQTPDVLPPFLEPDVPYIVNDWSPDGRMLAGQPGLGSTGIITYSFASRTYQRFTDIGEFPSWLPDSRRILFVDGTGKSLLVLDTATGQSRRVFSAGRNVIGPPRLTRDGRAIYFSRRVTESDIWLVSFDDPLLRSSQPD